MNMPGWAMLTATLTLIGCIMVGCPHAHSAEMRDCLEAGPYTKQHSDPLWSVWQGSDLLQIEEEEDGDVDHCYDPVGSDDEVFHTKRTGHNRPWGGSAQVFKPV